jgi:hypothetical protein
VGPRFKSQKFSVCGVVLMAVAMGVVAAATFFGPMAGLRMNDQKNAIAVTMSIVTAFKICVSHRKMGS